MEVSPHVPTLQRGAVLGGAAAWSHNVGPASAGGAASLCLQAGPLRGAVDHWRASPKAAVGKDTRPGPEPVEHQRTASVWRAGIQWKRRVGGGGGMTPLSKTSIGLSPLTLVLSLNPFPPEMAVPVAYLQVTKTDKKGGRKIVHGPGLVHMGNPQGLAGQTKGVEQATGLRQSQPATKPSGPSAPRPGPFQLRNLHSSRRGRQEEGFDRQEWCHPLPQGVGRISEEMRHKTIHQEYRNTRTHAVKHNGRHARGASRDSVFFTPPPPPTTTVVEIQTCEYFGKSTLVDCNTKRGCKSVNTISIELILWPPPVAFHNAATAQKVGAHYPREQRTSPEK